MKMYIFVLVVALVTYFNSDAMEKRASEQPIVKIMAPESITKSREKAERIEQKREELGKWGAVFDLIRDTQKPIITENDVYRALGLPGKPSAA
jgi:hypothetical protein